MTAVPSLLTCDFVGYCANAAGMDARQQNSHPIPKQILADRMTILWVLDIVKGSFSIDPQLKRHGQCKPGRHQAPPDPRIRPVANACSQSESECLLSGILFLCEGLR